MTSFSFLRISYKHSSRVYRYKHAESHREHNRLPIFLALTVLGLTSPFLPSLSTTRHFLPWYTRYISIFDAAFSLQVRRTRPILSYYLRCANSTHLAPLRFPSQILKTAGPREQRCRVYNHRVYTCRLQGDEFIAPRATLSTTPGRVPASRGRTPRCSRCTGVAHACPPPSLKNLAR